MAPVAQTWWSDSRSSVSGSISAPRHFAAPSLGAPRTPRSGSVPRSSEAPVVAERPLDSSRNEPTALCHNKTYRRGVSAPEKSSLPFFVLIGLAVGLFAFGMMTFCLPDPLDKLAAREAAAAQTFPAPVFKPVEAAPSVAEIATAPEPAAATVTTITPATKQARVIRRHPQKKPATGKTAQLPSNPYAN